MPLRRFAALAAVLALAACAPARPSGAPAASGPRSAPVPSPGAAGPIALDPAQRAELERVAAAHAADRAQLRYALAQGDDGRAVLVVYVAPRARGGAGGYVEPAVLNLPGAHYDPFTNELIAPIPAPRERQVVVR